MKQYRLKLFHPKETVWTHWRNLDQRPKEKDILTIQFNEPLTVEESKEFFKHYEVE